MSVLISDMNVPKNCDECPFFDSMYFCCDLYSAGIPSRYNINPDEKPEWCELVEIPDNKRIVNLDEYRDAFVNGVYSLCSDDPDNNRANAIIDLYDDAHATLECEVVRDCTTCKHGKYNDHWKMPFCYANDDCDNLDQWESKDK